MYITRLVSNSFSNDLYNFYFSASVTIKLCRKGKYKTKLGESNLNKLVPLSVGIVVIKKIPLISWNIPLYWLGFLCCVSSGCWVEPRQFLVLVFSQMQYGTFGFICNNVFLILELTFACVWFLFSPELSLYRISMMICCWKLKFIAFNLDNVCSIGHSCFPILVYQLCNVPNIIWRSLF